MADPMEPLRTLMTRMNEALQPLGLDCQMAALHPDFLGRGTGDAIQAVFLIRAEDLGKDLEQADVDAQFEEMTRSFAKQAQEDKAKEATENLRAMVERGGTFLGGTTEEPGADPDE